MKTADMTMNTRSTDFQHSLRRMEVVLRQASSTTECAAFGVSLRKDGEDLAMLNTHAR